MNAFEKLPKGTGVLKVEVSVFYVENNVRIYPYGFDDYTKPLAGLSDAEMQVIYMAIPMNVSELEPKDSKR